MIEPTSSLAVEHVPIDSLHPDPANPRRISDAELESLTRSLRQFGFVQPVLARREDAVVIGGHQRLVAARRLGLTTVPVTWLNLSVEQARLLNLALAVARLLGDARPRLLSTDPPYGVSLDPRWRDGVCNKLGAAERPSMRAAGHRNTTISGDTRVDWSEAFALVTGIEVGYVWHAGVHAAA